jgi:hypothetical protein
VVALIAVAAVLVLTAGAIWLGHHGLSSNDGPSSAGVGNAFGGFDVFDPARARMQEDLDSKETEGSQFPADDGDERPVRVDLHTNKVHIRKPADPPA